MNLLLYLYPLGYCYGTKQFCRKFGALSRGGVIFFLSQLVWPGKRKYTAWRQCDRISGDASGIVTLWYSLVFLDVLRKTLWNSRETISVHFFGSLLKNFKNVMNIFSILTIFHGLCMKWDKWSENTVACHCMFYRDFFIVKTATVTWDFSHICPKRHWWENTKKQKFFILFWPCLWLVSTVGHKWDTQKHAKWASFSAPQRPIFVRKVGETYQHVQMALSDQVYNRGK